VISGEGDSTVKRFSGQGEKVDFYIYAYTTNLCTSKLIKKTTITLDGKNMEIKEINDNELVIEGEILNISYNK